MKTIEFKGEKLKLEFFKYHTGLIGIIAKDAETNEPWGNLTIQVEKVKTEPNEIIVKDYSENIGIYKTLVDNNIIQRKRKTIQVGFGTAQISALNEEIFNQLNLK